MSEEAGETAVAPPPAEFKLFVRNLSWNVDEERLRSTFEEHGEVTFSRLCTDRETGKSRGFGFVSFASFDEKEKAKSALNGSDLDGRTLEVQDAEAKPAGERRAGGGGNERRFGGGRDNGNSRYGNGGGDRRGGGDRQQGGGGRGPCYAFQERGSCKFGDSCRFSHDGAGGSSGREGGGNDRKKSRSAAEDEE